MHNASCQSQYPVPGPGPGHARGVRAQGRGACDFQEHFHRLETNTLPGKGGAGLLRRATRMIGEPLLLLPFTFCVAPVASAVELLLFTRVPA